MPVEGKMPVQASHTACIGAHRQQQASDAWTGSRGQHRRSSQGGSGGNSRRWQRSMLPCIAPECDLHEEDGAVSKASAESTPAIDIPRISTGQHSSGNCDAQGPAVEEDSQGPVRSPFAQVQCLGDGLQVSGQSSSEGAGLKDAPSGKLRASKSEDLRCKPANCCLM